MLLPVAGAIAGRRRMTAVRRTLGLSPPRRARPLRLVAAVAGVALLGLAAAQPALTHETAGRVRSDAAALFVLDTSRSMAASATARSATRLDRAVAAAVRLRAEIPDVPSGVATFTDRVLPDLLPVAGVAGFDAVVERAVAIESPPPLGTAVRVTNDGALAEVASGNYFSPGTKRRLVVLLTDGESAPFDRQAVARALPLRRGYRFLAVRFWRAGEEIYRSDGKVEPGYRSDPLGRVLLQQLAATIGGRAYEEGQLGAAATELRALAGSGPTVSTDSLTRSRQPLAPYLAAIGLVFVLLALSPFRPGRSRVDSLSW